MEAADRHCTRRHRHLGLGQQRRGRRAGRRHGRAGDVPTLEMLAAVSILRRHLPGAEDPRRQRRGSDEAAARERASARAERRRFRRAVHEGQAGHLRVSRLSVADPPADLSADEPRNLHVRGYKEEGTITTPFDMAVLNDLDRFHLAGDAIDRCRNSARGPRTSSRPGRLLHEHRRYICETAKTCQSSATGDGRTRRTNMAAAPQLPRGLTSDEAATRL